MIGGDDGRALLGNVLQALYPQVIGGQEQGLQDALEDPVQADSFR